MIGTNHSSQYSDMSPFCDSSWRVLTSLDRSAVTTCSKWCTRPTLPTTHPCPFTKTGPQPSHTPWTTKCRMTVWFHRAPKNHIQVSLIFCMILHKFLSKLSIRQYLSKWLKWTWYISFQNRLGNLIAINIAAKCNHFSKQWAWQW